MRRLLPFFLLLACFGCDSASSTNPDAGAQPELDASVPQEVEQAMDVLDVASDPDLGAPADTLDAVDTPDVAHKTRRYVFRAIAGVSMGCTATMIAARNPEMFDMVGGLGGYPDITYLFHMFQDMILAGFCDREHILENIDVIADPDDPNSFCGPGPVDSDWERQVDYNHWYYSTNGGNVHRNFYLEAFHDFTCAFGNPAGYNPVSPLAANGIPLEWLALDNAARCADPVVLDYPLNLNAEYNPDGAYPLITFCDGHNEVGCDDSDPPVCGEDREDYWELMGTYNPDGEKYIPVTMALAVDYNRNGLRDWGEPVVINTQERFEDVGTDGCGNALEDGQGGCLDTARDADDDANGDDYDPRSNPLGTEHNWRWEEGEPYDDYGLDGVAVDDEADRDYGEGNGQWDGSPLRAVSEARDPRLLIQEMDAEQLERIDWWFDGGIRDVLNAAQAALHTTAGLVARGQEVRYYDNWAGGPTALDPDNPQSAFLGNLAELDLSAEAIGKNVFLAYGDPDATLEQIQTDGNGGHVGDGEEILLRLMGFFAWLEARWPNMERTTGGSVPVSSNRELSVYTSALDSRLRFYISLPPGYYDPENAEKTYPVLYFLHGLGQEPTGSLGPAAVVLQQFMKNGHMGRFILVFPNGKCCRRDLETGLRECACTKSDLDGHTACVDPTCTGHHDDCEVRDIPNERLERECRQGSFFMNMQSDKWGLTDQLDHMRYEDALLDLIHWVDENYRTAQPLDVVIPTE